MLCDTKVKIFIWVLRYSLTKLSVSGLSRHSITHLIQTAILLGLIFYIYYEYSGLLQTYRRAFLGLLFYYFLQKTQMGCQSQLKCSKISSVYKLFQFTKQLENASLVCVFKTNLAALLEAQYRIFNVQFQSGELRRLMYDGILFIILNLIFK